MHELVSDVPRGVCYEEKGIELKSLGQVHVCCAGRSPEPNVISPDGHGDRFIKWHLAV